MFANKGANENNIRSEIIDIFGSIAGENIEKIVVVSWDHNEIYGISKVINIYLTILLLIYLLYFIIYIYIYIYIRMQQENIIMVEEN
jgi:hypothetical protein